MRLDLARHAPLLDRQRQHVARWWDARTSREQMLLAILAGLAVLWMAIALVIQPIQAARNDALARIRTYEMLTIRLRQAGPISGPSAPQRQGSPVTILSASGGEMGLMPQITPDGAQYRVTLADAPYDAVLRWIAEVERSSHLRFTAMRIERGPARGIVSAQFGVRG